MAAPWFRCARCKAWHIQWVESATAVNQIHCAGNHHAQVARTRSAALAQRHFPIWGADGALHFGLVHDWNDHGEITAVIFTSNERRSNIHCNSRWTTRHICIWNCMHSTGAAHAVDLPAESVVCGNFVPQCHCAGHATVFQRQLLGSMSKCEPQVDEEAHASDKFYQVATEGMEQHGHGKPPSAGCGPFLSPELTAYQEHKVLHISCSKLCCLSMEQDAVFHDAVFNDWSAPPCCDCPCIVARLVYLHG